MDIFRRKGYTGIVYTLCKGMACIVFHRFRKLQRVSENQRANIRFALQTGKAARYPSKEQKYATENIEKGLIIYR
jgi:hypothetical protein